MSAAVWTVVLTGIGGALTWCTYVANVLWNFRGKWDSTNASLAQLSDKLDHLSAQDSRIEQRLERHLDWHERRYRRRRRWPISGG